MADETIGRRGVLVGIGATLALAACGGTEGGTDGGSAGTDAASTGADAASSADDAATIADDAASAASDSAVTSCAEIPDETTGPYPDTMNMIQNTAFQRSNIKEDRTGTALALTLTVVEGADCTPVVGARVMIWHCDKDGIYSEYNNSTNAGSTTATYCRGWQTTDANGQVVFETIYPGWYIPRATHIHVEVYDSTGTTVQKVTQVGFEDSLNDEVYAQASLYTKGANSFTNDSDQVWGTSTSGSGTDGGGHDLQITTTTGSVASGLAASIVVGLG